MFTPFAFVKQPFQINPIATAWATSINFQNFNVIVGVSNLIDTLQLAGIWNKMIAVYPMITDQFSSADRKTQFVKNLVNPATHTATYLNNASVGTLSGWQNAGSDTFITITPATIGNNYVVGFYTNSDAASTDQIDMGVYDPSAPDDGFLYCVAGRNKVGANAQIIMQASEASQPYNVTGTGPFTGLFGVGGNSTTGYAYRRTSQLGTAASYDNAKRGNTKKIGLGSFLQDNGGAISPTTKTYQFAFMSTFLNSTEFSTLATAVNDLQGVVDSTYSTSRKAYT